MEKYFGNYHCGAVKFSFLSEKAVEIWKCDCSVCEPYDYQHLFIKHEDFDLISGDQDISSYKFGTKNAEHLFCKICGIYTHHQRRSNPNEYAVNVGCIDEIDPYEYFKLDVVNNDGNNHILDRQKK